jgi:hypothetical protein
MRFHALCAVMAALPAGSVLAQDADRTFAMPQGCEAYATIQKRGCIVSHHFRCDADPEGHQRRVDLDENGMNYMGMIDSETQWIESYYPNSGEVARLLPGAADPASLTELIETGRDVMDFQTMSDLSGIRTFRGSDWLTGQSITLDGERLYETEFEMEVFDSFGNLLWSATGREYIHKEWRTFLSGTRVYDTGQEVWNTDNRPVEIIFPGQPGFLSSSPRHECGLMMSKSAVVAE